MIKTKPRPLNPRGFAHHFLMPVVAIIAVSIIGAAYLALSHAATLSANLYQGSCAQKYALTQAGAASANKTCTQQVQDLINIYQYSATGHFAIPGSGETFSYQGKMTMVDMNGGYNGATQSAVNTIDGDTSPSLTNASVSGSTINSGTWQNFCTAVHGKITTAAFTGHSSYNFGTGETISSSGVTIFNTVCGSLQGKSFSTGGSTTTAVAPKGCTSYAFSASSTTMPPSQTKPAPADCVRLIQTILNGTYQSNYKSYDSVADSFSSQTQTVKGLMTVDGIFGTATQSQLQAFQAVYNNLPVTGSVNNAANWTALCGEAMSFRPDTATWKKAAYQDVINVLSGQSKPWSGCNPSTAKQPTYSQHASAPTVGMPAPAPVSSGGGSGSGGSGAGSSLTASCSFTINGQVAGGVGCTVSNSAGVHYSFPYGVDTTEISNASAGGCANLFRDVSSFNSYIGGLAASAPTEYTAVNNAMLSALQSRFPHCY